MPTALRVKYDIVNNYGLRGAGIWALGYDNARPELWTAIKDKFVSHDAVHGRQRLRHRDRVAVHSPASPAGCSPTLFCPKGKVTRAQMAMFLDRALDLPGGHDRLLRRRRRQDRRRQHQRPGQGQDHRRLRPAPLLPDGLGHPRPDGDVPRPRPGPAQRHDRLLRRRRRQDRRRQHQRARPVRASPVAAAPAATARPGPSRASRWPPSCTAPTCRAASTEQRGYTAVDDRPRRPRPSRRPSSRTASVSGPAARSGSGRRSARAPASAPSA